MNNSRLSLRESSESHPTVRGVRASFAERKATIAHVLIERSLVIQQELTAVQHRPKDVSHGEFWVAGRASIGDKFAKGCPF